MVNLTIDGIPVSVEEGTNIVEAAKKAGVKIPALCYQPGLRPYGGCRVCLVELKKKPGDTFTACSTPVAEGMEVLTRTEKVLSERKRMVEFLLLEHPLKCETCEISGECELEDMAEEFGLKESPFPKIKPDVPNEIRSPFIEMEYNNCILCGRCARVCSDVVGAGAIDFVERGVDAAVAAPFGRKLECEHCGQCVEVCPVNALHNRIATKKDRTKTRTKTKSICTYCGVGCSLVLESEDGKVVKVTGAEDGVNKGVLCVKGRFGFDFINHPDRLTTPLIKKEGKFVEASWDEALDLVTAKFTQYKGDSFAALTSAKCTNEENYIFQKFVRGVMGTNNIDHCARL
jgi:NADH-quinone oxidoreductase subunit G